MPVAKIELPSAVPLRVAENGSPADPPERTPSAVLQAGICARMALSVRALSRYLTSPAVVPYYRNRVPSLYRGE